MSAVTSIMTMLQRFGFSDAAATYLTGTCGIDSLDEIAYLDGIDDVDKTIKGVTNPGGTVTTGECVKLLPLPQPPVRARMDARTNPSAQRATQLRSVLACVYAVSIQNQITTTVP
jgi:hypothetical protein